MTQQTAIAFSRLLCSIDGHLLETFLTSLLRLGLEVFQIKFEKLVHVVLGSALETRAQLCIGVLLLYALLAIRRGPFLPVSMMPSFGLQSEAITLRYDAAKGNSLNFCFASPIQVCFGHCTWTPQIHGAVGEGRLVAEPVVVHFALSVHVTINAAGVLNDLLPR